MSISLKEEMKKSLEAKQYQPKFLTRRQKFDLRYKMLNDDFSSQVRNHLSNIYTKSSEILLDRQMDLTNNILKVICNKISRVYSFGVDRVFDNDNTKALYDDLKINKVMKEANLYVNALNDVLLQVSWNYKENKPRLIFRYPHKTEVTLDEYDNPKEVEYFVEAVDKKKEKWAYWSDSEHYYKIYDGDKVTIEYPQDNEAGINPYGVLPFVFMQNGFRDGYFFDQYSGDDLVYITLDNAVYNTFKNYLIKWQSFKQLVITGSDIGAFSGQLLDPSQALTASGDDIRVDLLDLQSDLAQLNAVLKDSANNVAINYNISPNQFRMTGQVSSGFALQMENVSLDEYTREQQNDFMDYESKLFDLLSIISQIEANMNLGTMSVTFNSPTYNESNAIQADTVAKEINLGLVSPSKVLSQRLGIPDDEARAIYQKNIEERNMANERFTTVNPTVNLPIGG